MTPPDRKITHIGYVVADIEEAVQWAVGTLGAGPFFLIAHLPFETCTFQGAPARYDHSSAFGQWGELMVELTVVHSADPPELGHLMAGAPPGVGHVGWLADDLAADSAELEAQGLPVFHTGSSGPVSARWHDGRARLGHHVEILGRTPQIEGFYGLIASSAAGWDGSDPLRPAPGAG